jgi:hypothetical protein
MPPRDVSRDAVPADVRIACHTVRSASVDMVVQVLFLGSSAAVLSVPQVP